MFFKFSCKVLSLTRNEGFENDRSHNTVKWSDIRWSGTDELLIIESD